MSESLLSLKIGRHSVKENLNQAIAEGRLLQQEDGALLLVENALDAVPRPWLFNNQEPPPGRDCGFLDGLLFKCAYNRSAVPYGCRNCYKVKVLPRTLRELVALVDVSESFCCCAKCGANLNMVYTQEIYHGLFYTNSLDEARKMYHLLREVLNTNPKLGPDVPMVIKRGCTHFEMNCGPSDKYTFRPELPALEEYLMTRYKPQKRKETIIRDNKVFIMYGWIRTAFRIGDDTYLDLTGGKRLFPKTVAYPVCEK